MDNNALYCTIENHKERYFTSRIAGGFSYPLIVFNNADSLSETMSSNSIVRRCEAADLLPIMTANEMFPETCTGVKLFSEISDSSFCQKADRFGIDDDYSFLITLDFDKREIGYKFNPNALGFDLDDTTVSVDDMNLAAELEDEIKDSFAREKLWHDILLSHSGQENIKKAPVMSARCECRGGDFTVKLPLQESNITELKKQLNIDDIERITVTKAYTDLKYLQLVTACRDMTLSGLNKIAQWACNQRMQEHADAHPLKVFAAVLESTDTHSMSEMLNIIDEIDSYELLELFCAEDYGRYILETNPGNISDKEMLDSLEDYINYYDYGCNQAEQNGAVQTDYGFVFRRGDMEQTETQDTVMSM